MLEQPVHKCTRCWKSQSTGTPDAGRARPLDVGVCKYTASSGDKSGKQLFLPGSEDVVARCVGTLVLLRMIMITMMLTSL